MRRQTEALENTVPAGDVLEGGVREASLRLGIGQRKGYRLAAAGAYPFSAFCVRIGHTYVVPRTAFAAFLAGEIKPTDGGKAT